LPRKIEELYYASLLTERPRYIPMPKRLNGSQSQGVAYEKKVVRHLKARFPQARFHYHQWIQFADKNGSGVCEPELFVILRECVLLFECKRTGTLNGKLQLEGLYKPVLELIFARPVRCCLVCKHTAVETPGPFFETPEAFIASEAEFGTWHWLG
jgi:hypothetical protein